MKHNPKAHLNRWWLLVPVLVSAIMCVSCREDYYYDEREPEWLGESIFDYLVEQQKYTTYVKLIQEMGYQDVLEKTGSKTLFVVDDETFDEFFQDNRWGVESYADLTVQQKEQILYSLMLNNVFFTDMLGDATGPQKGMSLRRTSALSANSTFTVWNRSQFPTDNYYWSKDLIKNDSIILMRDNTAAPMVIFTNSYAINNSLKGSDYAFVANLKDSNYVYHPTDVFVNGVRVVEANIKCKNGVIHRLEKMVTPLTNMAEVVCSNESTEQFGILLDRFSAPFLSSNNQFEHPVYVKKYFTTRGQSNGLDEKYKIDGGTNVEFMTTPTDSAVEAGLKFDPGWNTLTASDIKPMNEDMSAMFVPTNKALEDFLHYGSGKFLYDRYGGWEGIPDHVLADLVNNHMKSSFVGAVPSKFEQVKNDAQIDMGVKENHVRETILCCNGVVYVTDSVYAPVSYVAVTAPTLVNDNMNIMRWAVEDYGFLAYLHSMDSYYSFLLPTDENLWYLDPLSVAKNDPEYWKFKYNTDYKAMEVEVYDSLKKMVKRTLQSWRGDANLIQNRLEDLIDQHIIVDNIDNVANGKLYYQTKGNGTVKVMSDSKGLKIHGGYQLETDSFVLVPTAKMYPSDNGKTYVMPSFAQPSLKSVYESMQEQAVDASSPFYQFFKLMGDSYVFAKDDTYATSGEYTVDVFNTYHYTIYVPSNDAILEAIANGLPTMEQADEYLASLGKTLSADEKQLYYDKISEILRDFVCYHIHDNSVYIGGANVTNREYQTSALNMDENLFRRLKVSANNESLIVVDDAGFTHSVNVVPGKEGVLYNVMARDYLFNNGMSGIQTDEDGNSKETDVMVCQQIETSSFAVIHGVDGVLLYDSAQLESYKEKVTKAQREFEEELKK